MRVFCSVVMDGSSSGRFDDMRLLCKLNKFQLFKIFCSLLMNNSIRLRSFPLILTQDHVGDPMGRGDGV